MPYGRGRSPATVGMAAGESRRTNRPSATSTSSARSRAVRRAASTTVPSSPDGQLPTSSTVSPSQRAPSTTGCARRTATSSRPFGVRDTSTSWRPVSARADARSLAARSGTRRSTPGRVNRADQPTCPSRSSAARASNVLVGTFAVNRRPARPVIRTGHLQHLGARQAAQREGGRAAPGAAAQPAGQHDGAPVAGRDAGPGDDRRQVLDLHGEGASPGDRHQTDRPRGVLRLVQRRMPSATGRGRDEVAGPAHRPGGDGRLQPPDRRAPPLVVAQQAAVDDGAEPGPVVAVGVARADRDVRAVGPARPGARSGGRRCRAPVPARGGRGPRRRCRPGAGRRAPRRGGGPSASGPLRPARAGRSRRPAGRRRAGPRGRPRRGTAGRPGGRPRRRPSAAAAGHRSARRSPPRRPLPPARAMRGGR